MAELALPNRQHQFWWNTWIKNFNEQSNGVSNINHLKQHRDISVGLYI